MKNTGQKQLADRKLSLVSNKSFSKYFEPISVDESNSSIRHSAVSGTQGLLKSQLKRPNSLGHTSNAQKTDSKIINVPRDAQGSQSLKRISWGPSKILEFYATEQIRRGSHESSENQSSDSKQASNQNRQQIKILNQNANQPERKDSQKRYSHITVHKQYEMPLVDSSMEDSKLNQTPDLSSKKSQIDHLDSQIKFEDFSKNQEPTQSPRADQEQNAMMADVHDSSKMNDEPTPRKSDVQQNPPKSSPSRGRRRSSASQQNDQFQVVGKTFDLRKSGGDGTSAFATDPEKRQLFKSAEDNLGESLMLGVQLEKSRSEDSALHNPQIMRRSLGLERTEEANKSHLTDVSTSLPLDLTTMNSNSNSTEVARQSISASANPSNSLQGVSVTRQSINLRIDSQNNAPNDSSHIAQSEQPKIEQPILQQMMQKSKLNRHSIADPSTKLFTDPVAFYQKLQMKPVNKIEMLSKIVGIPTQDLHAYYSSTNYQSYTALLDQIYQTTQVLSQLVIPTSIAFITYQEQMGQLINKLTVKQQLKEKRILMKDQVLKQTLEKTKALQDFVTSNNAIIKQASVHPNWTSVSQESIEVQLHQSLTMTVKSLNNPHKLLKLEINQSLIPKMSPNNVQLVSLVLRNIQVKLKSGSGLLLDFNNHDYQGFSEFKGKATVAVKLATLMTNQINNLLMFLCKVQVQSPANSGSSDMIQCSCLVTKDQVKVCQFELQILVKQSIQANLVPESIRFSYLFPTQTPTANQNQKIQARFKEYKLSSKIVTPDIWKQLSFLTTLF